MGAAFTNTHMPRVEVYKRMSFDPKNSSVTGCWKYLTCTSYGRLISFTESLIKLYSCPIGVKVSFISLSPLLTRGIVDCALFFTFNNSFSSLFFVKRWHSSVNLVSVSVLQDEENGNGKGTCPFLCFSSEQIKTWYRVSDDVMSWDLPAVPPVSPALQPFCSPYRPLCVTASKAVVSVQIYHKRGLNVLYKGRLLRLSSIYFCTVGFFSKYDRSNP